MSLSRLIKATILLLLLCSLPLQARAQPEIVIGDSIACGVKDAGHLQGGCHVGASPLAVLHMVLSYPVDLLSGQVVVLSSGVSNDPEQISFAGQAVAYLHDHGAHVVLLGVGNRLSDSVRLNDTLKFFSETADGVFVWGWQNVHPQNYNEVLSVIRREECLAWRICLT